MRTGILFGLTILLFTGTATAQSIPLSRHLRAEAGDQNWSELEDGTFGLPVQMISCGSDGEIYHRYELKALSATELVSPRTWMQPCTFLGGSVSHLSGDQKGCITHTRGGAYMSLWIAVPTKYKNLFEVHSFYFPGKPVNRAKRFLASLHEVRE